MTSHHEGPIGVIMLDTAFPRPPGDVGNPATFGGRVLYEIVDGATASRVIYGAPGDPELLEGFLAARDRLVARGALAITTSCGVLAGHQTALQTGCAVPVFASALIRIPKLLEQGHRIGLMAMDSKSIGPALLASVGAPAGTPVAGLENGAEIYAVLRRNSADDQLDPVRAEADVISAGQSLLAEAPDLTCIVLECANLPPYREALSRAVGLPVHDILTLIATETGISIPFAGPVASPRPT
ncbi:MAG: hypothetical protein RLZZ444_3286 [Pseudomonadota bacterium]|jgi:hypothetical protein